MRKLPLLLAFAAMVNVAQATLIGDLVNTRITAGGIENPGFWGVGGNTSVTGSAVVGPGAEFSYHLRGIGRVFVADLGDASIRLENTSSTNLGAGLLAKSSSGLI